MASIDDIVARVLKLHPKLIDLTLDRMQRLLAQLGNPQTQLPPVIHVAGTNGKGSTIAFMRAILEAAGLRVHVYTSPHLVCWNERFRIGAVGGGHLASDAELAATLEEVERINDGAPITVFEITTAVGLLLFARNPADVLLLEVGMGGRFDATNVIDRPAACAIAPVSLDHADYLGDTVEAIAGEKAGIIKSKIPVAVGDQQPEALAVIERQARRLSAPLSIAGEDWHVAEERGRLVYQDEKGLLDLPAPRLPGRHQFSNAGLAVATLRAFAHPAVTPAAYEQGIVMADWPARMQRIASGILVDIIPEGAELWLDGGHNADGGRAISVTVADLEERVSRPLVLIVGMLASKDSEAFLRNFNGLARRLFGIAIPGQPNTVAAQDIAQAARRVDIPAQASASLEAALASIAAIGFAPPPRILITGSLYLAGEVLRANGTPPV